MPPGLFAFFFMMAFVVVPKIRRPMSIPMPIPK
jgi:hypothetical protein